MVGCSVIKCKSRSERQFDEITFHKFPNDTAIKRKWVEATGRAHWQPSKYAKMCSVHFSDDSFNYKEKMVHLKPYSLPKKHIHSAVVTSYQHQLIDQIGIESPVAITSQQSEFYKAKQCTSHTSVTKPTKRKITPAQGMLPPGQPKIMRMSAVVTSYQHQFIDQIGIESPVTITSQQSELHIAQQCISHTSVAKPTKRKITPAQEMLPTGQPKRMRMFSAAASEQPQTVKQVELDTSVSLNCQLSVVPNQQCHITTPTKKKRTLNQEISSAELQTTLCMKEKASRKQNITQNNDLRGFDHVLIHKYEKLKIQSEKRLKKLRAVRESRRRLLKKIAYLENILTELKCKMLINSEDTEVLRSIETEDKEFLKRFLNKDNCPKKYSASLRKFALSLHFISPKAYSFVRKTFDTCLPHPKTLYKWYTCINCEPGFTKESLDAIRTLVTVNKSPEKVICAISLDEMSIRQHLQWDGEKIVGYVDVGKKLDTDALPMAKDALVFMVTAINGSWKLPVGYFLTNGVNGEQRCALLKTLVHLLTDCGVIVASVTFDGCPSNFAMARLLGAKFDDLDNINPSIQVEGKDMVIFPDPCHMIKLVRNTLADKKYISKNDEVISWEYFQKLNSLQESEGLHMANKLRKSHIDYKNQIMKVRLATQTFSKSVAEALQFCKELGLDDFANSGATIEFIEYFNNIFDTLNSRKLFSYGFKKPISKENFHTVNIFFEEFIAYIKNLKLTVTGESILKCARKTGFLGLIICVNAIKVLFKKFIDTENASLPYLCTYKLSQDHLELFFSAIRSKGGFNNNPTAMQFISAYRRLLVHGELKNIDTGNCIPLENINILNINEKLYVKKMNCTTHQLTDSFGEDVDILPVDAPNAHDYFANNDLSEFSREITVYISGFIVKKLKRTLKCEDCILSLLSTEKIARLITLKDVGGLHHPSNDVIEVCIYAERTVRRILSTHGPNYFVNKKELPKLVFAIFKYFVNKNIFSSIKEHVMHQSPIDNHLSLLVKSIALSYLQIRIHHVLKMVSLKDQRVRNQYTKLVLFKGQ